MRPRLDPPRLRVEIEVSKLPPEARRRRLGLARAPELLEVTDEQGAVQAESSGGSVTLSREPVDMLRAGRRGRGAVFLGAPGRERPGGFIRPFEQRDDHSAHLRLSR